MQTYWQNTTAPGNIDRGLYIILPLRYQGSFQSTTVDKEDPELPELTFDTSDFTELLSVKCRNGNFVKRVSVNSKLQETIEAWNGKAETSKKYEIDDLQLFIFNNGIAFITVYLSYKNKDVNQIYKFINPGYVQESNDKKKSVQEVLLESLEEKVFGLVQKKMKITLSWFIQDENSRKYIIKEAYRLNIASLPKRFEDNEIPKRIAYNGHRLVDVTRDFEDVSEMDVEYATGAKDVEDEHYGWACAITSQEISYAYGPGQGKTEPRDKNGLWERSEDDLLLTMIVMYQKYTCMIFNEKIHQRFTSEERRLKGEASLRDLKREALEFISYGTLAPSQISRWNNVCETYRSLQKQNGVNEALEEISQKITLLNEEQDRIDGERESRVSMIITAFGLISIIAAALQTLDYISTGNLLMIAGFLVTCVAMILFFLALRFDEIRRRRKQKDR